MRKIAALIIVFSSLYFSPVDVSADSRDVTFWEGAQWKSADSKLIVTELTLDFDGYNAFVGTSDILITRNGKSVHFRAVPSFTQCPLGSRNADCNRCASGGIGRNYWLYPNYSPTGIPEFRFFNCNTTAEGAFLVRFDGGRAEALAINDSPIKMNMTILPPPTYPVREAASCLTQARDFIGNPIEFRKLSTAQKQILKNLAAPTCTRLQACNR